MAARDAKAMLQQLIDKSKPKAEHRWQPYLNLLQENGGIVNASSLGFTVELGDGTRDIEFPGGLTSEHFAYFASALDAWDKTVLAQGVLRNSLGRHSYQDWETMWGLLRLKYGEAEEEWLPQRVEKDGFDVIAREMASCLSEHRAANPLPGVSRRIERPRFNHENGRLSFGVHHISFRKQLTGTVWQLLCQLEEKGFPEAIRPTEKGQPIDPERVKEARRTLQARAPFIKWVAHNDGTLSWDIA